MGGLGGLSGLHPRSLEVVYPAATPPVPPYLQDGQGRGLPAGCLDAGTACGSWRAAVEPRNPVLQRAGHAALAARQKYGSHCCLPANRRTEMPGFQPIGGRHPVVGWEAVGQLRQLCRRTAATGPSVPACTPVRPCLPTRVVHPRGPSLLQRDYTFSTVRASATFS